MAMDTLENDLRLQLDALDAKLDLVLQKVGELMERGDANRTSQSRLDQRLKNHEARLLSMERARRR